MRISDWSSDVCSSDLYDSATLARLVKGLDPSRLVDATSGWLDVAPEASDVLDIHTYEDVPNTPRHQSRRAIVLGEYGGVGFPVEGHIWRPGKEIGRAHV